MTNEPWDTSLSGNSEISALIEVLRAAEERLVVLTKGEVDTVSSRDGKTFLLRRAQDQLRLRDAEKHAASNVTLQRQNNEMRALFDLVPAMIWFKDTENRIVRLNQRAAEAEGRSVEEIEGKDVSQIHPDRAAKYYSDDLEVIRSGQARLGILEVIADAAGKERWVQTDKVPVRGPDDKVVGIVVMAHDVTERRHTEETLRLLSSAVEQSKEAILITDAELELPGPRIIFANPAFEMMTGYSESEVIGKSPRFLHGPRTDRAVMTRLKSTLQEGRVFHGEAINYRKNGEEFVLEWQITPMRDATGKITHYMAIERDVTERKRANETLQLSEKRFRALFDQASIGVAQTEAETGRYVQINQRFCNILGRTWEEMGQLTFASVTHPEDVGKGWDLKQKIMDGEIREGRYEKRYLKKDGTVVWADVTISAMWAPGERADYFIVVGQDITERKRLEEQFRQSQKMDAIGTLAGGIAHDFNNILAAINGYTELSQLTLKDNPAVRSHLNAILQAGERATALVRQILTFSRQQPLERRPLQLLPIVAETLTLLRATIPKTIEFETSLPVDTPLVLADASQVHQILMNLGTNAWHAMRDQIGTLSVKLERCLVDTGQAAAHPPLHPGLHAHISVGDTGSGMNAATLQRIFEPFFTTKPLGEGTGLGLAVVHGIMNTHDGAITVESEIGKGTTFHLYFPAHVGETKAVAAANNLLIRGHDERVLFVDDEELIADVGRRALTELGYTAESVTRPEQALEMVRANPDRFALIITDQTMPRMTGLALAAQLHELRPDLPIILSTGQSHALEAAQVELAHLRRVLPKPFTIQSLSSAVHSALSAHSGKANVYGTNPPH